MKIEEQSIDAIEVQKNPSNDSYHSFRVIQPLIKDNHKIDLFKNEDDFVKYSRRFNIDLAPKILFSKSESVDRLISSGVANYLEFNNVSENFFYNPEK